MRSGFLALLLLVVGVVGAQAQQTSAVCNGATVPAWVTANRPSTPNDQTTGYNLTSGYCETYSAANAVWAPSGSGGSTGTVTSVSVATANGLGGTVANATTTPAITLTTSVNGLAKGNGTGLVAATAGTDYLAPGGAGSFTTLSASGAITPSQTAGIVGTTTNNNANAGSVGEFVSSSVAAGSAVNLTTSVAANITSVSLTAGDWQCYGNEVFSASGATITSLIGWTSSTSATVPAAPNNGGYANVSGSGPTLTIGEQRFSVAATTTVYLSASSAFSGGTVTAFGFIGCRRPR